MLEIIVVVLLAGLSSYGAAATRMIWPGPSCCGPAVSSLQPSQTTYPKGAIPVFRPNDLMNALDTVLAWELSDASMAAALTAQANLLAGGDPEQINAFPSL